MTIPAWQLISWNPVRSTVAEFRCALERMRPWKGEPTDCWEPAIEPDSRGASLRRGQAFWIGEYAGCPVGLAWDWAEVRSCVPALSDPMAVLSNVRLVDDDGRPLDEGLRLVHLNSAVHELSWQSHLQAALLAGPRPGAA